MPLDQPPKNLPEMPGQDPGGAESSFDAAGFQSPVEAVVEWQSLVANLPAESSLEKHLAETWKTLSRAADPDLALRQLSRWIDSLGENDDRAAAETRWGRDTLLRESFVLLLGASPALGDSLIQEWRTVDPAAWRAGWETKKSMQARLTRDLAAGGSGDTSDSDFLRLLKSFQRREEIRLAFLDECLQLPIEQITRQTSWLADVVVEAATRRALDELARRFGVTAPVGGFAVLALGKLGGLELNYSSDIDVNFIMEPSSVDERLRDPALFFTRVAERVLALLGEYESGRPLYRVDTRLRPDGSRGRLVWTLQSAVDYYESVGRTWERLALIRARPIAGDLRLGRLFQERVDAFVFRKLLGEAAIEDLKNLKAQIESLATRRGGVEVKIGSGGIRDVEFIVQHLQLLHAAENPALKRANIFDVLETLRGHGFLSTAETDSLSIGYRVLRQVENRIQLDQRLQKHALPEDARELRRLSRGLGFQTVEAFRGHLASAQTKIRLVFRRLFESAATEKSFDATIASLIELPLDVVTESGKAFLERFGFEDPEAALKLLRKIAGENSARWDQAHAEVAFRRLAPAFLRELSQFPDPDRALHNFSECVDTLGARSVFFDLLRESEPALKKITEICGHSSYLIEIFRAYPGIFDEAIDVVRTGHRVSAGALKEEAVRVAKDCRKRGDETLRPLFQLKSLQLVVSAFRDLEGSQNLSTTMRDISNLGEALLHAGLALGEEKARQVMGTLPADAGAAHLVLAMGKLGGQEMNYRSDLDVVFLYTGTGQSDRGRTVGEYYTQLAQELFQTLQKPGPLGMLWEADARLRPMGGQNPLAVSFEAWQKYFTEGKAKNWERLAALRVRCVAGDPDLEKRAKAFIHETMPIREDEDVDAIVGEILDMRKKLEKSVPRGDIKRGRGGIMDVEFIVQTLQLIHGREHPEIFAQNTAIGLQRLMKAGLINPLDGPELLSAYEFLRWLETRFSLLLTPGESISKLDQDRLRSLIQRIGYRASGLEAPEEIFLDELAYHCERNRFHFERILGTGRADEGA